MVNEDVSGLQKIIVGAARYTAANRTTIMASIHRIQTEKDAIRFMQTVKFALRYNSTPTLPMASMYAAADDQRRAIELTNALLARDEVVETNVIADRLVLVHRDVVPALY